MQVLAHHTQSQTDFIVGFCQALVADMQIFLCGLYAAMTQKLGDGVDIHALLQKARGIGMARTMESDWLAGNLVISKPFF